MHFDEILELIGGFGRFQKWVFFLTCIPNMLAGLYMLNPVFLLGIPEHRCAIPGYENDTYEIQSEEHLIYIHMYIPNATEENWDYDRCQIYDTANTKNGSIRIQDELPTVKCDKWVYDKSVFEKTFVSQIDLVCDKDIWIPNAELIFYGGMLLGSLGSGILADRYGRKPVMYVSMVLMFGSSLALAFVKHYASFVTINFFLGSSCVAVFMPAYVISLEMTGASKRMWPAVISDFPYVGGLLLLAWIASLLRDWYTIELVTAIPGVVLLTYWWLMPESPRWLLTKGRVKEAEKLIRKIAKINKTEKNLPRDLSAHMVLPQEPISGNICQLFTSSVLRWRTLILFFNWAVVAFTYFGLSLNTENLAGDLYLNFFFSGLVEIPAYLLVIFFVDRLGRRRMFCSCMVTGGLSCVCTFFTIYYLEDDLEWLTIVLAMVGKLGVSAAYCVLYIQSAELLPTVVRNAGMGGASVFARAGTMVSPYLVDLGNRVGGELGEAIPLIVFGGISLLSGILSLCLPETLNKELPETIEDGERFGKSGGYFSLVASGHTKFYDALQQSTGASTSSVEVSRSQSKYDSATLLNKNESHC